MKRKPGIKEFPPFTLLPKKEKWLYSYLSSRLPRKRASSGSRGYRSSEGLRPSQAPGGPRLEPPPSNSLWSGGKGGPGPPRLHFSSCNGGPPLPSNSRNRWPNLLSGWKSSRKSSGRSKSSWKSGWGPRLSGMPLLSLPSLQSCPPRNRPLSGPCSGPPLFCSCRLSDSGPRWWLGGPRASPSGTKGISVTISKSFQDALLHTVLESIRDTFHIEQYFWEMFSVYSSPHLWEHFCLFSLSQGPALCPSHFSLGALHWDSPSLRRLTHRRTGNIINYLY